MALSLRRQLCRARCGRHATPGGGSVAAYSGMLAVAGADGVHLTLDKAKYAAVHPGKRDKAELERLTGRLSHLIAEDAASFDAVLGLIAGERVRRAEDRAQAPH